MCVHGLQRIFFSHQLLFLMKFGWLGQIKICVFWVTSLKLLGRVGAYIFFYYCFTNIILCILKLILPFKMHTVIFFPENLKKFYVSSVNLGRVWLL